MKNHHKSWKSKKSTFPAQTVHPGDAFACLSYPTLVDHIDIIQITLEDYIKNIGPLSLSETLDLLTPLTNNLSCLHSCACFRGDISPCSLMISDPETSPKLVLQSTYFSQHMEDDLTRQKILKQGYAPLEMYYSSEVLGCDADIYSLSAVICFCLTGIQPPSAPDRILSERWDSYIDTLPISVHQKDVLRKGMAMLPSWRFFYLNDFMEELKHMLNLDLLGQLNDIYQKKSILSEDPLLARAQSGDPIAQYNAAYNYYYGIDSEKDINMAVKLFKKSAEQGNAKSQNWIGYFYRNGIVLPKDYQEAVKWYQKSAEQGYFCAQYNLGVSYQQGIGVCQDWTESAKWYRKAAEQGDADAQYMLGEYYYYGKGVPKYPTEAVKWYFKSADQGCAKAQYQLGVCLEYGYGIPENKQEALKMYRKAAAKGNENAKEKLSTGI